MNIEYLLNKRKTNLLEWLHDHRVYSLESFKATLQEQQLDASKETLDLVKTLYTSEPISSIEVTPTDESSSLPDNPPKKSRPKKASPPKEE